MKNYNIEISKMKTANDLRFLDLQSFETKCRTQQSNTLLFWQEKKIKEGLQPIRDINRLLEIVSELQTQVFETPKRVSTAKRFEEIDKELEQIKNEYINTQFEKFKKSSHVIEFLKIFNSDKEDFRNKIIDNIEKGTEKFIYTFEKLPIESFEYREGLKVYMNNLISALSIYRKLKYDK